MEKPLPHDDAPMVVVRVFPKLALAREAALALAAREMVHRIDREGSLWILSVEEALREEAEEELAAYEAEQQAAPLPIQDRGETLPVEPWLLLTGGSVLAAAFRAQQFYGERMLAAGNAESAAILRHGQWWRCVTALFLHGDFGHLLANLVFGLFFVTFLMMQFGAGMSWLLVVVAGAVGNALNALGYFGEPHRSIGASTAVFAAIGLLVGAELYYRRAHPGTRSRRHLFAPLGAGLALLAILGVGESHEGIDYMAHGWGFVAGVLIGLPAAEWKSRGESPAWVGSAATVVTLALVAVCWFLAVRA
jgi:membrane associated rhomboid family serine protease